jgi:hypothetical protein
MKNIFFLFLLLINLSAAATTDPDENLNRNFLTRAVGEVVHFLEGHFPFNEETKTAQEDFSKILEEVQNGSDFTILKRCIVNRACSDLVDPLFFSELQKKFAHLTVRPLTERYSDDVILRHSGCVGQEMISISSDLDSVLSTIGLGECLGIGIYNEETKKRCLLHVMMPLMAFDKIVEVFKNIQSTTAASSLQIEASVGLLTLDNIAVVIALREMFRTRIALHTFPVFKVQGFCEVWDTMETGRLRAETGIGLAAFALDCSGCFHHYNYGGHSGHMGSQFPVLDARILTVKKREALNTDQLELFLSQPEKVRLDLLLAERPEGVLEKDWIRYIEADLKPTHPGLFNERDTSLDVSTEAFSYPPPKLSEEEIERLKSLAEENFK